MFTSKYSIYQVALPSNISPIDGEIKVLSYQHEKKIQHLGSLLQFNIENEKKRARKIVSSILNIEMDGYHAMTILKISLKKKWERRR